MTEKYESNDTESYSTLLECMSFIESVLAYKLSATDKQPFLFFHDFLTNPEPKFLKNWKNDSKMKSWHEKFGNRIIGDVQNAFPCVLYHADRIIELESAIISGLEKYDFRSLAPKNSSIGGGNTLIFDFEYQAYILAFRRCLEYLARAVGSYFMNEYTSFRKLGGQLKKLDRPIVAEPLIKLQEKYAKIFKFVISDGNSKSVRDVISHYEFVFSSTSNYNTSSTYVKCAS